jgi:P pilus assembly chaperone PapD
MKKVILFLFIVIALLIVESNVYASAIGGVKINTSRIDFKVKNGESETAIINITNQRENLIILTIENQDFCRDSLGNLVNVDVGMLNRGCSKFVTVSPSKISLEPGEKATLRITIEMPDSSDGTYWSELVINEVSKNNLLEEDKGGGRIVKIFLDYRWEIYIYETVPESQICEGEIAGVQITFSDDGQRDIELDFKNTGNIILIGCNGYIEIRDESGNTIETLTINEFNVYPDGNRIISTEIPLTLEPGEYSALAVIDYGGEYLVAGEAFFEVEKE